MDFADIDKQFQAIADRWLCLDCAHCWFGTLTRAGCPNCGADTDRIEPRPDLAVDHQGTKQ